MPKYFYRAYDKYQKQIFTIAIFSDEHKNYQPNEYQYKFLDTELTYKYRIYKILAQKETELKKSNNLFAMAVLAGLYAIKSKKDMDIRYKFKVSLSRLLLEQKQSRKKIEDMFIKGHFGSALDNGQIGVRADLAVLAVCHILPSSCKKPP